MQKITSADDLKIEILKLEEQSKYELILLKEEFHSTYEKFKPLNLIKSSLRDMTSSPEIKNNLIGTALGLASGYLSKSLIVGSASNPLKKILGAAVQLGVSTAVSKNPATTQLITNAILKLLSKIKTSRSKTDEEAP